MKDCLSIQVRGAVVGSLLLAVVLAGGCNRSSQATAPAPRPTSAAPPTIKANPNPAPAGTTKFATTTISWDTGDESLGEVYVSVNGDPERRFSGALAKGSQEAAWIGKGDYEFRLYAGKEHKTLLATVKVTRSKQ
jgi:hypothetical protein